MSCNQKIAVSVGDEFPDLPNSRSLPSFFSFSKNDQTRIHLALSALCLLVLVFICYRPLIPGSFLMDDQRLIQFDNPLATGALKPHTIWFQSDFPLSMLALWVQGKLWGQNPAGFHVINVLLQGASAVLLWRLLAALKIPGAWLVAAVFAVHPVCVASVGRIAEIKNTLSLPFLLLSFWAYLKYERYWLNYPQESSGGSTRWYALALLAFVFALLSKTTAVMLPVMLIFCALWQRRRLSINDILHTIPFFALSLGFGLMSIWFQKNQALGGEALAPVSFGQRLLEAGYNFWFYLVKAVWPVSLNAVYAQRTVNASSLLAYVPLVLILTTLVLCIRYRHTWGRHVLFALACFAVNLLPALGFVDAQFMTRFQVSDHLQYVAMIAPVTLVVAAIVSFWRPRRIEFVAVPVLAILMQTTYLRAQVFSTEESLWRDTLKRNPTAWGAANDLGCILAERKDYPKAAELFTASLQANPRNPDAHANLGQVLSSQSQWNEAERHFGAALKLRPNHLVAHQYYAQMLERQNRDGEALIHFQAALSLRPDANTHMGCAGVHRRRGENRRAITHLRQAADLSPKSAEPLNNLAWMMATSSDPHVRNGKAAVEYALKACRLTGFSEPPMMGTLAAAYAEAGRYDDAATACEKTIRLAQESGDLGFAGVNRQLLLVYRAKKPFHEAPTREETSSNQKRNFDL